MSSSLNLRPDLPIIGIQAGIFLLNMWAVKKLMLEPYLRVKAARDSQTGGSQEEAQLLLVKAAELDRVISEKMRDAHKAASATRETLKSAAAKQRAEILLVAETKAKKEQADIQRAVAANLTEERAKRAETVAQITDEFVRGATQ